MSRKGSAKSSVENGMQLEKLKHDETTHFTVVLPAAQMVDSSHLSQAAASAPLFSNVTVQNSPNATVIAHEYPNLYASV